MIGAAERFARRWWAGEAGGVGATLTVLLAPISALWWLAAWIRGIWYDLHGGVTLPGLAVVSVGNLAVGGTGKTPFASWVASTLADAGGRPAILLRGYGRDEALLHAMWTPAFSVVMGADRVRGAREARAGGADVAVLDDGFQHRRLARGLDIVLLALEDDFPGRLLPRGPYREAASALTRADVVIVTRRSGSIDEARCLAESVRSFTGSKGPAIGGVHLTSGEIRPLGSDTNSEGAIRTLPREVLVLTAIARPRSFLSDVQARGGSSAELLAFGDHHDFSARDARAARARAGTRPIAVTEKDAVKVVAFCDVLGETWVVGQALTWDWGEDVVRGLVTEIARGVAE